MTDTTYNGWTNEERPKESVVDKTHSEIADTLRKLAEDIEHNPSAQWEEGPYRTTAFNIAAGSSVELNNIRRKPRAITYTVTRPEPYRGDVNDNERLWLASPIDMDDFCFEIDGSEGWLIEWREAGLVYLTKEDAIAAAKAMIGECDA